MAGATGRRTPRGAIRYPAILMLLVAACVLGVADTPNVGTEPAATVLSDAPPGLDNRHAATSSNPTPRPGGPASPAAIALGGAEGQARAAAPTTPTAAPPAPGPAVGPRTLVDLPGPAPGARPVAVRVPAIGVDAPLIELGLNDDHTLEVPETAHDVGWYTKAPPPGHRGPAVLAGHVNLDRTPGVFHKLLRVGPGDRVQVDYDDGTTFTFVVYEREQHAKDAFPTERVYGNTEGAELRLITCGGPLDRQNRRHLDNVIVYADLLDRT